jgi:TetR/AcrR family transcriptional repressor of nem operon
MAQRKATVKKHTAPARAATPTKRKLIDAAHALIWANSYSQVSVDDICQKAGVRKGSFYHFFPSKAELACAALEDYWLMTKVEIDALFSNNLAPHSQLKAICRLILDEQKESFITTGAVCGCPYAMVGAEIGANNEKLHHVSEQLSERFSKYLEKLLKNAAKSGLIPATGTARKARDMHIYIMGAMLLARLTNSLTPVGRDLELALLRLSGMGTQSV